MVAYTDFEKLDFRVGEIRSAEEHPNADKLYVLKIYLGEEIGERTIVAGIRKKYEKEELIGKKIIVIVNLEPAVLRGIKSEGMLLAAGTEGREEISLLTTDSDIEVGAKVK